MSKFWAYLCVGCSLGLWAAWAAGAEGSASAGSGGRSAGEVIEALLEAHGKVGPVEGDFSWVIGPVGVGQQRLRGRLYIVGPGRYRVEFESAQAAAAPVRVLLMPDGRWVYQFSPEVGTVGMRVDLGYVRERVRNPAPRAQYDPAGGALLEWLRFRAEATYEGDEDLPEGRCAVLSYPGRSVRLPRRPQGMQETEVSRTRLWFRREDGLLLREEELDPRGEQHSVYQVFNLRPLEPRSDLLTVPKQVLCVDATKQWVRRLLYGPPRPAPGPKVSTGGPGAPGR